MTVRKLIALAVVPVPTVRLSSALLSQNISPVLRPLCDYFQGFRLTRIQVPMWNCYNRDYRTNNHVEGWNRRFNAKVRRHHTNFWHFVSCLRDEENAVQLAHRQFSAGQVIAGPRNGVYAAVNERLARLKQRLENGELSVSDYWNSVSQLVAAKH